jgi:hypothetical protein
MTDNTAHQRSTTLASNGRIVFTGPPERRRLGPKIERNERASCDHPRCGRARHKLSRFCVDHERNHAATGHPTAATVRRTTWAPYVAVALSFINAQLRADHPGIEAGVKWCAEELLTKGAVVYRSDPRRPHRGYQAALTRARRHGTEGGPYGHSLRSIRRNSLRRCLILGVIESCLRLPSISARRAASSAAVRSTGFAIWKT